MITSEAMKAFIKQARQSHFGGEESEDSSRGKGKAT